MLDLCQNSTLTTYQRKDFATCARCPIRGEILLPDFKPEEKVRLKCINFLFSNTRLNPNLIDIRIEEDRLDITIGNKLLHGLMNAYFPSIIIEVKRMGSSLNQHSGQLIGYLERTKCKFGILFDCDDAIVVVKGRDGYISRPARNAKDIEDEIYNYLTEQSTDLETEINTFDMAQNGDFNSFQILATKYRRNRKLRFRYWDASNLREIETVGYLFDFQNELVHFAICGFDTKTSRKPFFERTNFRGLFGIGD